MGKLSEVGPEQHDFFRLKGLPWFAEAANHSGLARGGVYLLSGPPGAGKTTLALQIAVDLAWAGRKVLYIAMEQSPAEIRAKIQKQVFAHRKMMPESHPMPAESLQEGMTIVQGHMQKAADQDRVLDNFYIDANVNGMEALPDFLARHVLGEEGHAQYAGTQMIVVDSIQGLGTAPTSSRPYQRLFEFNRWAKEQGKTVILIGHITKGGAIAGPRSLEHNVDCVLYLRKAMRLRPLFVPKNRFGPERHEPLCLIMDRHGCLEKSKHAKARASLAFGYLPGQPGDIIEVQALVRLPKYGDKAGIKAPYLPWQKLNQLVSIVSSVRDIDISDLTFEINCAIPGGRPYYQTLDLPLVMSMLSSYLQEPLSSGSLFVGEVDLFQAVRPVPSSMLAQLANCVGPSSGTRLSGCIKHLYISGENAKEAESVLLQEGACVQTVPVDNLEDVIQKVWPHAIDKGSGADAK